jgi:hypothetical protein
VGWNKNKCPNSLIVNGDNVKKLKECGLGVYNVFYNVPVIVDNAIETPVKLDNKIHHIIIYWLNGNK